jgi:hypothetical protein
VRITIGHALILTAAGYAALNFYVDPSRLATMGSAAKSLGGELQSWISLFHSAKEPGVASEALVAAVVEEAQEVQAFVPEPPVVEEVVVSPIPVVSPAISAVTKAKTATKPTKSKARAKMNATTGTKTAKSASQPRATRDTMLGRTVRLELTSGQSVTGVLEARNPQEITIQLPGMGPFVYSARTVKAVSVVE